jgi:hypothetical protein
MVISDAEKKVLLQRLELARVAKQKKAAEAKAAKDAKQPLAPAPAPAPVPEPEPVVVEEKHAPAGAPTPLEKPPASEPIDIPPIPDLVKASKKPAKKVVLPDSDSDDEPVMPKKKTVKKDIPYMKIKLYKEPSNPEAFQHLLEAVNDTQYSDEEEQEAPPPPFIKGPRVLQKVGVAPKRGTPSSLTQEDVKAAELRRLAFEIFG